MQNTSLHFLVNQAVRHHPQIHDCLVNFIMEREGGGNGIRVTYIFMAQFAAVNRVIVHTSSSNIFFLIGSSGMASGA